MKATGIVKRVDDLGRIVIPKEITSPVALEWMVTVQDFRCRRLDQAPEGFILTKFSKFIFSHSPAYDSRSP